MTTGPDVRGGTLLLGVGAAGVAALVLAMGTLLLRAADTLVPRTQIEAIDDRGFVEAGTETGDPGAPAPTDPPLTGVRDVLVVGLDTREGLTEAQLQALGTEDNGSRLTDTIMWVQYDADEDQVRMVSFPRDLQVHPGGGRRVKLNSLHARGGPDLLVSTLENIVGEDLDHYVEINMAGFIRLADTLDGVEVCLRERMYDLHAGVNLPGGCHDLTATQATGFVRARGVSDEFGQGTAGRAARQQYFIRQAVADALSSDTLTDPSRGRALVSLVRESVVVDQGFSTTELVRFAHAFRSFDPDRIVGATVPFTSQRLGGRYYDQLTQGAEELFAAMRSGHDLPDGLVTARKDTEPPSSAAGPPDDTAG